MDIARRRTETTRKPFKSMKELVLHDSPDDFVDWTDFTKSYQLSSGSFSEVSCKPYFFTVFFVIIRTIYDLRFFIFLNGQGLIVSL